jgi:hypothetical protein
MTLIIKHRRLPEFIMPETDNDLDLNLDSKTNRIDFAFDFLNLKETKEHLPMPKLQALRHRPKEMLEYLMQNIEQVLTPTQLKKFCILDEGIVLGEFTSLDQAQKAKREKWSNICTYLYVPPSLSKL